MFRVSMLALLAGALSAPAHAVVYTGPITVTFRVDRPDGDFLDGTVDIDRLEVWYCGAGYEGLDLQATDVDPVVGYSVSASGGDICSVVWYFDSDVVINGNGSQGLFTVEATDLSITSPVGASIPWVAFGSYSVTSGTMAGSGPRLLTTIQ